MRLTNNASNRIVFGVQNDNSNNTLLNQNFFTTAFSKKFEKYKSVLLQINSEIKPPLAQYLFR